MDIIFFKYYKKRFRVIRFIGEAILTFLFLRLFYKLGMSIVSYLVGMYDKSPISLILASLFCILSYPCSIIAKRYCDYLQYGKVNISRLQLITILKVLSPRQFEYFCAELFREIGHEVHLMPDGPDGGKDVIVDDKIYVECKRYNIDTIGRPICQKLLGAVEADNMEKGILFTNGKLSNEALEVFAKTKRLELWNIDTIYLKLNSLENHRVSLILDKSLAYIDTNKTKETMSEFEFYPDPEY